jgi:hypothetical protein
MTRPIPLRRLLCCGLAGVAAGLLAPAAAFPAKTGFQKEVGVKQPTRLDWKFVASSFGPQAAVVPKDYDSKKQRYQLYVPKNNKPSKAWPLVVFISPGDEPNAWDHWKKACTELGMLFCAPYQVANKVHVGQRTRIVLDAFDDVRRRYQIDPDQTYLAGFSGGGRMACTIAFALPEYFAGVIPICETNPINRHVYLKHRLQDRGSVAFVTGEKDMNRKENENQAPYFKVMKIRSKLWVVPKMGHAIPPADVVLEVHEWLAKDLKRRRADAKAHPDLAVSAKKTPSAEQQAARLLKTAKAELKKEDGAFRAYALLAGVAARWDKTEAADEAQDLIEDIKADPKQMKRVAKEVGKQNRREWPFLAKNYEKNKFPGRALTVWKQLAQVYKDTPEGEQALKEIKRLEKLIAALPKKAFIGVMFKNMTLTVGQVVPKGPADKAGIMVDDVIKKLGDVKVTKLEELAKALEKYKPDDTAKLTVERDGETITIQVKLGTKPVD